MQNVAGPNIVIAPDNKYGADNSVYAARIRWSLPNREWNQRRPWRSTGFLSLFAKKKEVFRISARGRPIRCIKRITQKAISDGFATDIF